MKIFFLQIYGLIMGFLLLTLLAIHALNNYFYTREVQDDYVKEAEMLTRAIHRELGRGGREKEILEWWGEQLSESDAIDINFIPRPSGIKHAYVQKTVITEAEDKLEVIVPFDTHRALRFSVHDRSQLETVWFYYGGYASLYLLLAPLLYALTHFLYRHIEAIRLQAQRVANGNYSTSIPPTSIPTFSSLYRDLNFMTKMIYEKTKENQIFTGAIHHELRTPLTRLRLALDMARTTRHAQEVPDLLEDMNVALDEISHLTEDLLTLSRLRLAQQPIPHEMLALDELLEKCVARLDDGRIQLNLTPYHVYANRPLLERALNNLLENACKFAREQILISLDQKNDKIELDISDDGPGIPEEVREQVKQPFFRVGKNRGRYRGGIGLGLAIADMAFKDSGAQWEIGTSSLGGTSCRVRWTCQNFK